MDQWCPDKNAGKEESTVWGGGYFKKQGIQRNHLAKKEEDLVRARGTEERGEVQL